MVADLPKLKAAVETGDPPTVQPLADEYRVEMNADLLVLTGRKGEVLGAAGADAEIAAAAAQDPRSMQDISSFAPHGRGVLQLVSVPILLEGEIPDILGRLTVGVFLDDRLAAELKSLTGSEIAFGAQGRILASTLPASTRPTLAPAIAASTIQSVGLDAEEFLVLARPLRPADGTPGPEAVTLILRSRTDRLRFLSTIRTGLAGVMVVTLLVATLLSYGVALTMTRPLATVTAAMREVAATGDLTRKVALKSRTWDDEDARLLASTFNTLTESIARFQREATQKDRLSSLGRLSTVIAHEIRNPLMIIRASLSSLRRDHVSSADLREAVSDIDEETTRLNRLVTEVLDFARPIRFELAEADLNQICSVSAEAAWTGDASPALALDLDPAMPPVVTDAERLRSALVDVLTNARQAVLGPETQCSFSVSRLADHQAVFRDLIHAYKSRNPVLICAYNFSQDRDPPCHPVAGIGFAFAQPCASRPMQHAVQESRRFRPLRGWRAVATGHTVPRPAAGGRAAHHRGPRTTFHV